MEIEALMIKDIKNKIQSMRTTYKVELNILLKANKSATRVDTQNYWHPNSFDSLKLGFFCRKRLLYFGQLLACYGNETSNFA